MRRLLKTFFIGGWVVFFVATLIGNWESESLFPTEYSGLAHFALGVLLVTSVFYLVSAKKDVAVLGMIGVGLGICLRASISIGTAPEGEYADRDLVRYIWGDAPALLSHAIIGGMLGMRAGELFRTARQWWIKDRGGIGDDDEYRRSNTYESNRPLDH